MLKIFFVVGGLICSVQGFAQNFTNRGKEFWVGYGHHQFMETGTNTQEMILYLSAEQPATVTVTIDSTTWTRTYNIPANTVIASDLIPKAGSIDARLFSLPVSFGGNGGEGLFRLKGIHIVSNVPIVAYAHIYGSASSGASMLMPIESWGYSYTSLNSAQQYANNCYSWFYAIATHDSTLIEITPSVPSVLGKPAGVPFTALLMKGQIYQYTAAIQSGSNGYNASGSTIKSIANAQGQCYPIAVFCGSSRTSNPASCGSGGGDNDNQQAFPHQAWGKRYLTAPTSRSSSASQFQTNNYRVLVKDPTTVVKRNGSILTGLTNNYYYFESSTADYIEADKPIMVGQFMTGGNCMGGGGNVGDPEMIYISPIEQAINKIGFYRNTREAINVNYLTMVIPTAGVSSLLIDGSPAFDHSYAHPNLPGYTVVVKRWSPSSQAQCLVQSDSAFTAITYGLGSVESYGYNAGTYLKNLNARPACHNVYDTASVSEFTCTNTPFQMSVFMAYKPTSMVWKLSTLAPVLTPNADVTVASPVPVDSPYVNGIKYYRYTLPGNYYFSDTGTYNIPIASTHPSIENCYNSEEVKFDMIVKGKPISNFNILHSGCTSDSAHFMGVTATSNNYTVSKWKWEFPGPVLDSGQNVARLFAPGTYNVKLTVISTEGCLGDTTKPIVVQSRPTAGFTLSAPSICLGAQTTLTDTSLNTGLNPVTSWWWDFGNTNTANGTSPTQLYTYPNYGTFTIKHVSKSSNTCVSDTVSKIITVYAKPVASFTYPSGCLPANGLVAFTNTTTVPDGQAISNYAWNFGDPNATVSNPNTSTVQNPTHNYLAGTYNINLSATTANGCTKDTTVSATFNLKPALAYPPLGGACQNGPSFSVANATVTNGVTGTGVYSGPGTSSGGMFTPSVAGPGIHTIWYVFTATGNCKDSISQTIQVHAAAQPNFTYPSGCLGTSGFVQFTNTTTISDGQALSYAWNFGDPNANAGNPNTSTLQNPSHNYSSGNYSINLIVTTVNNCISNITKNVTFNLQPSLAYPPLAAVCQNIPTVSVATATVTNGATGTGVYQGPGTSSNGTFTPSIAGPGVHTIWYIFTATGNCKDSVSQTILVHAQPQPNFTYPSGCIGTNGFVQFTNTTTIADAQTLSYSWNFGDPNANGSNPNTSTLQNPSHNFLSGTYNVNLSVTSSNGCIKDTTKSVTFNLQPSLAYPPLAAVCQNIPTVSVATATVTNGATGTGIYQGPGTSSNGTFTPSVAGPGVHTIWYIFTATGNCKDSISQTILVHAQPQPNFTYPSACLNANGLAQFTNSSTIADAQTLSYSWNFGDPNANGSNPNTSTLQNPTHNFLSGTYNVNLNVTSSNGCVKDTTKTITFNLKPALAYPSLPSVCQNIATVSVATATVTNAVTGSGVYSGPGVNAAGIFSPGVAGPGIHTIKYTFTSAAGCADSITQTIKVHPKPAATFTVTANVCQNQAATITDQSTIVSGNITNWAWDFGDATNASYANGNPFTKTYSNFNSYTIRLIAKSDSSCSDTTTRTVAVHAVPVANFTLPTGICMPGGNANFTNTTTVGDNAVLSYQWNFGDASPVDNNTNPSHVFPAINTYTVQLTATSSFGCVHSVSKPFGDFYDKPVALFIVAPDTLCQGADNIFTDQSTAPNSSVTKWSWNFDDGGTSTSQSPVKKYANAGIYDVALTVTNTQGCVSAPFIKTVVVYVQPVIDAGPSFVVPQGTLIKFNPKANDSTSVSFTWSPSFGLSSATALRPTLTAMQDQTYTLTAIGQGSCQATDFLTVKILKPVVVPNAFSPNGDGVNDTWVIQNLGDYPGVTVDLFNRYGQQIFHSNGYGTAWDGMVNGKPLPVATYYYVIELKNGFKPLTGSLTIVR